MHDEGGWTFPGSATKAHAFDLGRDKDATTSLCGKWLLLAVARPGYVFDAPLTADPSKSDCVSCARVLKAQRED